MDSTVTTQLESFFANYPSYTYKKGDLLLRPDENPQGVLYIKSGFVRMYQVFNNGKEITLNIFRPGSYFPMIWAITNIVNIYYCEAMSPTTVYKAPKEDVLQLLKNNPGLLMELTNRMVVGFYSLIANMELLLSDNASQRVSMILIVLANRFGQETGNKTAISLAFSHEEIAKLISLTRETTSLEMKKLKDLNIINYSRSKIVINDLERLKSQTNYQQTQFTS